MQDILCLFKANGLKCRIPTYCKSEILQLKIIFSQRKFIDNNKILEIFN